MNIADANTTRKELVNAYKVLLDFKRLVPNLDTNDFVKSLKKVKETHPKLYQRFITRVLSTQDPSKKADWKTNLNNSLFIQNMINKELNWPLLGTTIWDRIKQLNEEVVQSIAKKNGKIVKSTDKLKNY